MGGRCPIPHDLGMSKMKLDDRDPSSSKDGMVTRSKISAQKKARHEGLERTYKDPSIVVDNLFTS